MIEVPELSKEQIQEMMCGFFVRSMQDNMAFIMQKLGPGGLEEYNTQVAKSGAEQLKTRGVDNPLKFAMDYAVFCKNVLGSDVEVEGDEEKAVLNTTRCATLEVAWELKEKGMPIPTKEEYCAGCADGYFKKVVENLGLQLSVEFTEKGCNMTITK